MDVIESKIVDETPSFLEMTEETQKQLNEKILQWIATDLKIAATKVNATVALLDEGNTIPFIARYRKEMTGELDENQLRLIEEKLQYLRNLEERKREVLRLIHEQDKLTPPLQASIENAVKMQELEDLYRPYRPKRKTRAGVARERGLEPLAMWVLDQPRQGSLEEEARKYINTEQSVNDEQEAIQGAMDIIAEMIADDAKVRAWVRKYIFDHGTLVSAVKEADQESVYEMYYDYQEPVSKIPPHRILAMNRGEREGFLKISLSVPVEKIHKKISDMYIKGASIVKETLESVVEDAYKRLIEPSVEREVRNEMTEKAEEHAIHIFAENLRNLLLQAPVKGNVVLGVDPAYRTGCKLAVIDETGKMLEIAVTYPTPPNNRIAEAKAMFTKLIERYGVQLIVIGNGTASRETEQFVVDLLKELNADLQYIIVSEAGASVYSASKLAQTEFPDLDVAERSAISIARRLQDPLAELVKIEPKAIGVGQYQHDVNQKRLDESLGVIVESVVNHVGVDLNTASPSLLSYVAGVNGTIAKNIVKHREEHGKFVDRQQLRKVPRLGDKTFEQCVGFLRISDGTHPLDRTPIHPESYPVVDQLFAELGIDMDLLGTSQLKELLGQHDLTQLAGRLGVGVPTLRDIVDSLLRPGRDPREELPPPIFRTDVLQIEDLHEGMELQGTVRNVIDFGAFVDIGIKNDGLVHISQMSDRYVKHPMDVVSVGDTVTVWILGVDVKKGRVSLTMRKP